MSEGSLTAIFESFGALVTGLSNSDMGTPTKSQEPRELRLEQDYEPLSW
jgi:hypothetical protein